MSNGGRASHPAWALPIVLGVLCGVTPQTAPAQVVAAPCRAAAPDSKEARSGQPLDYQARPAAALQTVSMLPPGRLGQPYRPARIIYGGTPDYTIDPTSRVPPGLFVTPSGVLQGTPSQPGDNVFTLIARDSAQPANVVRGTYLLRVGAPRHPKAAHPAR